MDKTGKRYTLPASDIPHLRVNASVISAIADDETQIGASPGTSWKGRWNAAIDADARYME